MYSIKWFLILRSIGGIIPFKRVVCYHFIGLFFNNFLPTAIGGDAARVYYIGRRTNFITAGISVFLDRFLGFFTLTAISIGAIILADTSESIFDLTFRVFLILLLCIIGMFSISYLPIDAQLAKFRERAKVLRSLIELLLRLLEANRILLRSPVAILMAVSIVAMYMSMVTVLYIIFFRYAGGYQLSFWPLIAVLVSISVLSNIPISINGIGLREQLHWHLLAFLGIPMELSVSISFVIFSCLLLTSLVGWWFWVKNPISFRAMTAVKPITRESLISTSKR